MQRAAHDGLISINITVPDFQVETAIRVGANPGFELYRGTLATEIGQRHEVTCITFLTFGEIELFHGGPPPNQYIA